MQKVKLPLNIDANRAAQKRLDYDGIYPKESMSRLAESVVSINSDIDTKLSFSIDSQRLTVITGQAEVLVTLRCERCGKPFQHTVHASLCFSPVKNEEQAEVLPSTYEAVEINEFGEIDLLAMLEDEIILSLPIVPVHEDEHCEVSDTDLVFGELPEEADSSNPFAVLASLKQK